MLKTMKKLTFFAILTWASAAAAQPADVSTIDQSESVAHLNSETVVPALKVVTGNHLVSVDENGALFISATATNGLKFEVHFHGCDTETPARCKAMSMVSTWPGLTKPQAKKMAKPLAVFLPNHPFANAGTLANGRPYIARYVIADFGTKQGNLLSEFSNFIRVSVAFNALLVDNIGQ